MIIISHVMTNGLLTINNQVTDIVYIGLDWLSQLLIIVNSSSSSSSTQAIEAKKGLIWALQNM